LALRWADVDLEAAEAVTRHADNKGNRDEKVALHTVVIEHLRAIQSFDDRVFPWDRSRRRVYTEFAKIQDAAGIDLPCPDAGIPNHGECTPACHRYSFHDERRAFATLNAESLTREALQALMRHQDSSTTDRYINYAQQIKPAVAKLHVPAILQTGTAS
jgi:integrase